MGNSSVKNFICEDLNHPGVDAEQSFEKVITQKSHSHYNIYFTSTSCQNNDMQLPVPSENPCLNSNDLYDFFKNDDYQKLYNQVISKCKSYHLWQAKNWFLNELIRQKIFPKGSFQKKKKYGIFHTLVGWVGLKKVIFHKK